MYRWCAKHKRLVMFLWVVPMSALMFFPFLYLGLPGWFYGLFVFLLYISALGFVLSCPMKLLGAAEKSLNEQCDPYPLLKETEYLLTCNRSKTARQLLDINRSCALGNMGEYTAALEVLEAMNIDQYAQTLPITKVVYYNNLAYSHLRLGALEKAEIWHNKSMQLQNNLKNNKYKTLIAKANQHSAAEIAYHHQDYPGATALLSGYDASSLQDEVSKALLLGKIYLAEGKIDDAEARLRYVIDNGNKLIHVQIATDLLATQ